MREPSLGGLAVSQSAPSARARSESLQLRSESELSDFHCIYMLKKGVIDLFQLCSRRLLKK